MRILFLSDTHLGLDMPSRPRVARRRRGDDFFANYERALEAALGGEVDVVVHGGDLLYRSRVPPWLVEASLGPLKRMAASGVQVLLVPGNHERGQLPYPLLALQDGLHVFDRPRTVVLEAGGVSAAFIGFPYTPGIGRLFPEMMAAATQAKGEADVQVLCIHQLIQGATCGPGNFTFRFGPDVIRVADLPREVAVTLSGHIHRHQVLRPPLQSPVIYAGSVERTSFAEAGETKGFVMVDLTRSGLGGFEFSDLPARPMVKLALSLDEASGTRIHERLTEAIESTPEDAVVRLEVAGWLPPRFGATLRSLAGSRNVTVRFHQPQSAGAGGSIQPSRTTIGLSRSRTCSNGPSRSTYWQR